MSAREVIEKLPPAQVEELLRLSQLHPGSTWHLNDCGCCVCLHPGGDKNHGYIIGSDGESDLV